VWALVPVVARHQRGSPSDLSVSLADLVQFAIGRAGRPGRAVAAAAALVLTPARSTPTSRGDRDADAGDLPV